MSDAVMVPREPTEAMLDAGGLVESGGKPPFGYEIQNAAAIWEAMLAASTPVGGWEEPVVVGYDTPDHAPRSHVPDMERLAYNQMPKNGWRDLQLFRYDGTSLYQWFGKKGVNSDVRDWSVFEDTASDPFMIAERLAPPPPSVSIDNGSRPQEAVPSEQADKTVLALRILYDCAQDVRKLLNEEPAVQGPKYRSVGITFTTALDVAREALREAQPADGCSSNEGAAQ